MNRKTLIFCLAGLAVLIALTVTGIFVLYRNSDTGKAPEKRTARAVSGDYRLLEAVPSDAVMLLVMDSAKDAFDLLTDSTKVFSALMTDAGRRGFTTFTEKARGLMKGAPAVVSLHYSGELMPLMIIRAQADTTFDIASVLTAAEEAGLKSRLVSCPELTGETASLHKETLLEVSWSETLIASSERHIREGSSILEKGSFSLAAAAADGADALFVCHGYASKLFAFNFRKPYYDSYRFFGKFSDWSAWALDDSPGKGLVLTASFPDEEAKYFAPVLKTQGETRLPDILPAGTVFALSVPNEGVEAYLEAYRTFLDADGSLNAWLSRDKALKDSSGLTPLAWARKLDIREVAKATVRTAKGTTSVLLLRPGQADAGILLRGTGLERMKDYKPAVLPYSWPGFAQQVFGAFFAPDHEQFFTWSDGWMIVGDEATLTGWADGSVSKHTLRSYCADNNITLPRQSAAFGWYSPGEARDLLGQVFEKPMEKAIRKTLEGISAEPAVLTVRPGGATLEVRRIRVAQVKSAVAASADTTVEIPAGPFPVTNSGTGKTNRLGQAPNGTLTLKDENGKSLWGVPFSQRLCGRVSDIDYYANGKIQFLFAAGSKLYLMDRLGRFVNPFPVDLGKEILLGPDVYDFTGAKGYSAMVLHKDNSLGLYDLHGRLRAGWEGIRGTDTIKNLPELLTVKGKKFWAVRTASRTDIYPFGGGQPLTKAEGDKAFRHDSKLDVKDGSVSGTCYDGRVRSVKLVK